MTFESLVDSLLRYVGIVRLSEHIYETEKSAQACSKALGKLYFQSRNIELMREVEQQQADRIAELEAVITKVRGVVSPSLIPMTTVSGFVQPN